MGGWPCAELISVSRLDSEYRSAADHDANADFASLANLFALLATLFGAALTKTRPFLPTLTLPRLQTEVLSWSATWLRHVASCSHHIRNQSGLPGPELVRQDGAQCRPAG